MQHETTDQARYVDLHELCCRCGEQAADGPEGFSHWDGSPLCENEPVEVAR